MPEGLTPSLAAAAAATGMAGFLFMSRVLALPGAAAAALARVLVPLVYFAWCFDGSWTFLDDRSYLFVGERILSLGYNPMSVLCSREGITALLVLSGSSHILYPWWNVLGEYLFGAHYYAPVFLNVILVFADAFLVFRLAILCGLGERYARWLALFLLFHWEITAWSSFTNLKDTLGMSLTLVSLYLIVRLAKRFTVSALMALGGVFLLFSFLRFYIPPVIVASSVAWMLLFRRSRRTYLVAAAMLACGLGIFRGLGLERLVSLELLDPRAFLSGAFFMALTPRPWGIDPEYSFLLVPAVMHWLFFIPAAAGGAMLWRRSREAALPLLYLLVGLFLYGAVGELQGPRHRLQFAFIVAWAQFHFLWVLAEGAVGRLHGLPGGAGPEAA